MIASPSKYTSLKRLKQIQKDNYIGEGGQEYCPFEVETLINEKLNLKADALIKIAERQDFENAALESSDAARWSRVLTSPQVMKELRASVLEFQMRYA